MFLSEFSIKRPVVTLVVTIALMVFGYAALTRLKTNQTPDVQPPVLVVSIPYPGASPETVEREVINRIEDSLSSISGIRDIRAYARDSVGTIVVIFEFDKNLIEASQEIRDSIATVRDKLPSEMKEPYLRRVDPSAQPVMNIALFSDSVSHMELSRFADQVLARELRTVPGVALVDLNGEQIREMTVQLKSAAMRQANVSVAEVLAALRAQNLAAPVGRVESGMEEQSIRLLGRLRDVADFENVVVRRQGEAEVRLGQVANIEDGHAEQRSYSLFNGQGSVGISVTKSREASTVSVTDELLTKVEQLHPQLPSGAELQVVFNEGEYVRTSLNNVIEALTLGALLTVLTVYIFLNSWRSTVITALALPTSVLAAFIAVWVCGFTLNFMSLLGLSLAIGVLIDDAIVVRENIVRHMEMGKDKYTAAREGTKEIGLAVIATTMAIIAVFVPVAFMDGMAGQWFKPFGLTVAASVLVSLFISFSLDPMLSAYWGDPDGEVKHRTFVGRGLERFNAWFDRQSEAYSRVIAWALHHRKSMWSLAIAAFLGAFAMIATQSVGSSFLPDSDNGAIRIDVTAPSGSSLAYTRIKAEQAAAMARALPETEYTQTTVGSDGNVSKASIMVEFVDQDQRSRSAKQIAQDLRADIARLVGAEYTVADDLNNGGQKPLQIQFRGPDSRKLTELVTAYMEKLKQVPGAVDVGLSTQEPKPELQVELDRGLASSLGISMSDAATALRVAFAGVELGDWIDPTGETRNVTVRLSPEDRAQASDLETLPIVSKGDQVVPLKQVATISMGSGPAAIEHFNRENTIAVTANVQGRSFGEVFGEAMALARGMEFPPGYDLAVGGAGRDQAEVFGRILGALGVAVLLMYLILVMQFHSFLTPVAIMLSLPLSLIGVVLALKFTGATLNLMSLIGVVMLMGLVAKNAILLIDFARKREAEGIDRDTALIEAGKARLRPILMTSFALVAGMLPVAIGLGEGSDFYRPMGIAIIGGVITSTVLTLLVVPTFYDSLETRRDQLFAWGRRVLLRRQGKWQMQAEPSA
ncbi:efflux RND transporter permease subunit [Pseudomarimonas arenosa]|uniref:Efflux RND transporter permease subunit n=1 Tax=Pseudomarimonas arenosa TaxID=2774145 RepID=A0AAW3ZN61_9GAMM|nr:efflux RND transporter permease subunit [Pseudomarimonas arenosa]MBD8526079.1 efflux RND transporter permease subunit [Pseudomarimonas arenosa]